MKREFGLLGVIVTVVGYVIGASIFILPGQLAATVGPAVIVSYALAAVIALFACIAAAQIGSLYPNAGAGFIAITKLVSPVGGFLTIWLMLAAYIFAIALIANGFSEYFVELLPTVNKQVAAYGVVLFFGLLNLGGVANLVKIQTIIVTLFMIALAAVSFGGLFSTNTENLKPFMPAGLSAVIIAVVPAFFSYGGFMVVMEMAGEIKNPARTIPLGLIVSFIVVLVTYISLSFALVGTINWQLFADMNAPVSKLSEILFGNVGSIFVTIAAVGAAATSVNALILVASRDIIALANAGLASSRFSPDNSIDNSPANSVLLVIFLSVISLALGQTVMEYAVWVSAITLIYQAIIGVALLLIFAKANNEYQKSNFKISPSWLKFWGVGSIIISLAFLYLVFIGSQGRTLGAVVYLFAGIIYYLYQTKKGRT
ncbi:MAG: amino acid permease [Kordiimonadaceae bacterium]|nr:amino acid permease [Kordiimonadaceae bacterium]